MVHFRLLVVTYVVVVSAGLTGRRRLHWRLWVYRRFAVGNWSFGSPRAEDWLRRNDVLRLVLFHRPFIVDVSGKQIYFF